MEKINAIGLNLKFGIHHKRLWFAVPDDDDSKLKFKEACKEINRIGDEESDWLAFLKAVEANFREHGFDRMPK
jgi:hypothetical protein